MSFTELYFDFLWNAIFYFSLSCSKEHCQHKAKIYIYFPTPVTITTVYTIKQNNNMRNIYLPILMFADRGTVEGKRVISATFHFKKIFFYVLGPNQGTKEAESNPTQCLVLSNPTKDWGQNPSYVETNFKKSPRARSYPSLLFIYTVPWIMFEPWLGEWIILDMAIQTARRLNKHSLPHEFLKVWVFCLLLQVLVSIGERKFKIIISHLFTPKRY